MSNHATLAKPQLTVAERNAINTARVLRDNSRSPFCTPIFTQRDTDASRRIQGRSNSARTQ